MQTTYTTKELNEATARSQWFSIAKNPNRPGWYLTINEIGEFEERRYAPASGWSKGKRLLFWSNLQINFLAF